MTKSAHVRGEIADQVVRLAYALDYYQTLRGLYEACKFNEVLTISPNYDLCMAAIVALGKEAAGIYQQAVLDFFTGLPVDFSPKDVNTPQ